MSNFKYISSEQILNLIHRGYTEAMLKLLDKIEKIFVDNKSSSPSLLSFLLKDEKTFWTLPKIEAYYHVLIMNRYYSSSKNSYKLFDVLNDIQRLDVLTYISKSSRCNIKRICCIEQFFTKFNNEYTSCTVFVENYLQDRTPIFKLEMLSNRLSYNLILNENFSKAFEEIERPLQERTLPALYSLLHLINERHFINATEYRTIVTIWQQINFYNCNQFVRAMRTWYDQQPALFKLFFYGNKLKHPDFWYRIFRNSKLTLKEVVQQEILFHNKELVKLKSIGDLLENRTII